MVEPEAHDVTPLEPIEGSAFPRPASGLVSMELDGELLLLDPRTDGIHHLDALGTIIWKVLDGQATVDELVDDFADAFDTPNDVVRADLGELLITLRASALLEGSEPPAHLLVGTNAGRSAESEGLWRPDYLVDPPAP